MWFADDHLEVVVETNMRYSSVIHHHFDLQIVKLGTTIFIYRLLSWP